MDPSNIADGPRKRAKTALFAPPAQPSTWAARQEGSKKVAATGKQKGKAHRGGRKRAAAMLRQLPVEKGFKTQTLWLARDTPDALRFPLRRDGSGRTSSSRSSRRISGSWTRRSCTRSSSTRSTVTATLPIYRISHRTLYSRLLPHSVHSF